MRLSSAPATTRVLGEIKVRTMNLVSQPLADEGERGGGSLYSAAVWSDATCYEFIIY